MPQDLTFLADAPDLSALDLPAQPTEADEHPVSRVQLFKTGRFRHPRFGLFTVNQQTFDSFKRNFQEVSDGRGLPVDFDHAPQATGDTRARGWITSLDQLGEDGSTPTSDQLWGSVEWNWDGAQALKERAYRFLSPTFYRAYVSDDETKRGPTLLGAALTNYPFLERMAVVSLSRNVDPQGFSFAEEVASDSRPAMSDLAKIAEALGLAADTDEATILTSLGEKLPAADAIVLSKTDHEKLVAQAAKAPTDGQVTLAADNVKKLIDDAAAGREAKNQLDELRFTTAFTQAMEQGKVGDAEREALHKLYELDPDTTLSSLEARQPVVNTAARGDRGGKGEPGEAPAGVDQDAYELDLKVSEYLTSHADEKGLTYDIALSRVLSEVAV